MMTKPIELGHCVEIYVPSECRNGQILPEDLRQEVLEKVKSSLYDWFGGGTKKEGLRVDQVEGSWRLANGEMANERVDVVYANAGPAALEEHYEDLPILAAEVANQLTQESVAFRVDKKMILIPGEEPKSQRGAGDTTGSVPPSIEDRMRALQAALQRISNVRDARDLFCNILHYGFKDEQLVTASWPDKLKACLAPSTAPRIIADQNGFKILHIQLADTSLRRGHEREIIQRLIKDDPTLRGLVAVSNVDQNEWHLVNAKFEKEEGKKGSLRLRRMRVGSGQSVRTAVERLAMVDIETAGEDVTAAQLQDLHDEAFDVEKVSREFFNEISNWYFWALSRVEFPTDTLSGDDDEKHRATSLIRFLTRIIFCWFLKEKDLIPPSLFREKDLADILTDLDEDSCSYHQGILQNLFFATLNQRMDKDSKTGKPYRAFARDEGFVENRSTYSVDTLYRYEEHFQDPDKALSHFAEVPFLNGGLFECLDLTDEDSGKKLYVDGFSRNKKKRARVPNELFFSGTHTVDLSDAYGDKKWKKEKVRGLLNLLHAYNFTVEENTPIDEEIALDPELLGKVFENLLASYNEETKTTARKQTGSFYTPRPIVEYMVDESLKAHLCGTLTKLGRTEEEARDQLDLLLGYTDEETSFTAEETDALLESIHSCKILDPACGSGAFPMGALHKLVHVLHKLDPHNDKFEAIQVSEAQKIEDREARRKQIEQIGRDFSENNVDYGRKLYLIENCLYGVDIQPVAIQLSKLRFFISLICDQTTNHNKVKNHGIRALPNLETKFVAADTLIGLPRFDQELLPERVHQIESEIENLYHRHFSIQRRDQKLSIQSNLKSLRQELGQVLSESLGSSQKAQHLAEWNPFDSQASANFFDPHWMFGQALTNGFDIVLANPPYVVLSKNAADETKRQLFLERYEVAEYKCDLYALFIEAGVKLLREGGNLVYIVPNPWLTQKYFKKLRKFLLESTAVREILTIEPSVFQSVVVNNAILHVERTQPADLSNIKACGVENIDQIAESPRALVNQGEWAQPPAYVFDTKSLSPEGKLAKSIILSCDRLDTIAFVSIGCQAYNRTKHTAEMIEHRVFHSDAKETPDHLLEIGGGQVARYNVRVDQNKWIKYGDWLHDYRGPEWLDGPRILVREITAKPPKRIYAAYTGEHLAFYKTVLCVIPKERCPERGRFLCGLLNSSVLSFVYPYAANKFVTDTFPRISVADLKALPVCNPPQRVVTTISTLVQMIESSTGLLIDGEVRSFLDELADACVMECYFHMHMEERDLLFTDLVAKDLKGFKPDATETKQRDFLEHFHSTLHAKGSKIRDRLDRICTDSPDLLAFIKKESKV